MTDYDMRWMVDKSGKQDPWCCACKELMDSHEDWFCAFREKLPETDQEELDLYIAACESFCTAHIFVAYRLGREHGELAAYSPATGT